MTILKLKIWTIEFLVKEIEKNDKGQRELWTMEMKMWSVCRLYKVYNIQIGPFQIKPKFFGLGPCAEGIFAHPQLRP